MPQNPYAQKQIDDKAVFPPSLPSAPNVILPAGEGLQAGLATMSQQAMQGLGQLGGNLFTLATNPEGFGVLARAGKDVATLALASNAGVFGLTAAGFSGVQATAPFIAPLLLAIPEVGPALSAAYLAVGSIAPAVVPILTGGSTAFGLSSAALQGAPTPTGTPPGPQPSQAGFDAALGLVR